MKNKASKPKKKSSGSSLKKRNSTSKQMSRIIDDENTTNSEASEHAVFSDINWEENLEVDTTSLLEEFAPQALPRPAAKVEDKVDTSIEKASNESAAKSEAVEFELCDIESFSDYHIGLKILILNYKTSQWIEGVIDEIDQEEEEVLVRYDDIDGSAEEWLSMTSQRIKKRKSLGKKEVETPVVNPIIRSLTPESSNTVSSITEKIPDLNEMNVTQIPPEKPISIPSKKNSKHSRKRSTFGKLKSRVKKPTLKKTLSVTSKVEQKRSIQVSNSKVSRRLPVWKSQNQSLTKHVAQTKSLSFSSCKFAEGEKVLAKWSDHRMQKFPAVIKRVCGDRLYDVLFYDGFVKTIVEDNIYKTTEEEMAKYKECKPSEGDMFVDIDLTSKHERRQKKRKTFDGFFEEKDFKRPKKMESYNLNQSESFQMASFSRNKPSVQSLSVRNRAVAVTPKKPPVTKVTSVTTPTASQETLATDNKPSTSQVIPSATETKPISRPTETIVKKEIIKHEVKKDLDTSKSSDLYPCPLEITCHDGVIRKSILIDDNKLPPGWTKHVIAWVENVWACFLFTPDKYAVHSLIELKKYFKITSGQEPPEGLDFSFSKDRLQDLIEAQKSLLSQAIYRKWVNKILDERKVTKKVRILPPSRSIGAGGHFGTKRVRTLLPRYRSVTINQGPSVKTVEGKVWRCPKSDCGKKFRKENLLHMHIKHYHTDLSEFAESAPKVADLALARTSSDGSFMSEPPKRFLPKSPVSEPSSVGVTSSLGIDSKAGFNSPASSSVQSFTPLNSCNPTTSPQNVTSTVRVMTPVKQSKPKLENDIEKRTSEVDLHEKPRSHTALKSSKKHVEIKSLDDGNHPASSRSVKKKPFLEKSVSIDPFSTLIDNFEEEIKDEHTVLEKLQSEEIINCICGFKEEDGLMVQCEICLCWQHGACHGMDKDSDVPDRYVCTVCLDPLHVRSSQKYSYANQYLTVTKLPRFSRRTCKVDVLRHRERILTKSFELTSNLQSIHRMERALNAKINIAQQSDHPKLYLWSTNWDSSKKKQVLPGPKKSSSDSSDKGRRGPVGEAPIESIDCRLRLLDRIEADQQDMESRLTIIQQQLQALESEDFEMGGDTGQDGGGDPLLKQAIYMLLRDLSTISTAVSLS